MKTLAIALLGLFSFSASNHHALQADLETDIVKSSGDAADDTSIWVNPHNPEQSLIVGTDKKWGLNVYDLDGKKVSEFKAGEVNNIDSREGFTVSGQVMQIFAGSERSKKTVDFYRMNESTRSIEMLSSLNLGYEPYGMCVGYVPGSDDLQVFVPTKKGFVGHWVLQNNPSRLEGFQFSHVRDIKFSSVTEGCAVDDVTGDLFVAEESKGLWRVPVQNPDQKVLVDQTGSKGNLVSDVEGVSIYRRPGTEPLLLVSSQGDNSFHVYSLNTFKHLTSFTLTDGSAVDGVNDTDGIEVTSLALNPKFPMGFFIAQDGSNESPQGVSQRQNFKIMDFRKILALLP